MPANDNTDPVTHNPRCDGAGYLTGTTYADRVPVLCPACRPEAVAARERADLRARIGAGPRLAPAPRHLRPVRRQPDPVFG